jgi:IS4 transposase
MQKIVDAGSSFVMRLHRNAGYEVLEEKHLTEEAKQAGVLWDRIVRMGLQKPVRERMREPVRLVKIHVPAREPRGLAYKTKKVYSKTKRRVEPGRPYDLLIATNRVDLEADIISLIYRHRWTVEIFFRTIKCLLGCRHLVSDCPEGVAIQIYCALIAALLLAEHTGRRPGKRAFEIMTMYLAGWCTAEEAIALMEKYSPKKKQNLD